MLDTLNSLLAFAMLALAAYGLGGTIARGLRVDQRDDLLATAVWSLSLGLLAGGILLTLLGLLGCLWRPVIGVTTWAGGSWGLAELVRVLPRAAFTRPERDFVASTEAPLDAPPNWLCAGAWVAMVATAGSTLVAALAPPTAGDALCYHLELPKIYLQQRAIVDLPYSDNGTFPLLVEMLYLWGLALEGPVAAQLVAWGMGLLLALAGVLLATPLVGRSWAWLAGAVVLAVPSVTSQMSAPLNDGGVALWLVLGLVAWRQAVIPDDSPGRWFIVAGLMWGAALGTKYSALLFALAVSAELTWSMVRRPEQRKTLFRGALVAFSIALCVGGAWYVRAAWYRSNPVYPFFSQYLGGDEGPHAEAGSKTPLGKYPWNVAAAPWQVTMQPERLGGRGHQIGPLFLMAAGGLLFARRLRGLGSLLAVAGIYGALWFFLRQNVRFLLPIVPLLAVGVVWTGMELRRFAALPRTVAAAALMCAAILGVLQPLKRARELWPVALGVRSRQDHLARHEPTYQASMCANQLPPGARILSQDYRAFYFQPQIVRESIFRRRTRYDLTVQDAAGLRQSLTAAGITHLLLCDVEADVPQDETLTHLVEQHPSAVRPLLDYRTAHVDGARHYRLLELRYR